MTRDDVRRSLICYDITDDKRRTRVSNLLSSYGDRIQFSVFVVDISPARLIRLKAKAKEKIDKNEDSILFCDLGRVAELSDMKFSYLGQTRDITDNHVLVF